MILDEDRIVLIEYRLEQARKAIVEVEKLISCDLLNIAVNRIYYGIFYCLNALALKFNYQSSKHLQLIGWFNKDFIKTGFIDAKYSKILRDSYKNRSDSDYAPFVEYSKEDVQEMFFDMKDFIDFMERFILKA